MTGKLGKTSFGILAASDKAPGNYTEEEILNPVNRPKIDEFIDKNSMFAVIRLKRDFGKENNIGFFGTYRDFPEQKNLLVGFDGRFKLSPTMTSVFQVVGSMSKRCFFDAQFEPTLNVGQAQRNRQICGTGTFDPVINQNNPNSLNGNRSTYNNYQVGNGMGYYFNMDYSTEKHGWFVEVGGRSKFYRADSGFTRQTNTNFAFLFNRFSTKSNPKGAIIRKNWNQFARVDYDWAGRLQGQNIGTNVNLSLQKSTSLNFRVGNSYSKIYEEEFGLKRSPTRPFGTFFGAPTRAVWQQYVSTNINQTPTKRFNYGVFLGMIRNAFDYFFFRPFQPSPQEPVRFLQDPGPGKQFDAEIYGEVKPIDPLRISASYRKSRLVRNDNSVRSFDADIITLRSTYQFTRFLFTRFRLDYDATAKNYSGQALFGWDPNPGTAFYVGYNDNFRRNGFSDFTGQFEPGFNRNSRTFFIRASYLFRKSF